MPPSRAELKRKVDTQKDNVSFMRGGMAALEDAAKVMQAGKAKERLRSSIGDKRKEVSVGVLVPWYSQSMTFRLT